MKFLIHLGFICLIYSSSVFGQAYNGPSTGTVSSGVIVSTDNFSDAPLGQGSSGTEIIKKYMEYEAEPYSNNENMEIFDDYTYIEDSNLNLARGNGAGANFELHSFESIEMTNSIPPDLHVAVGPNHVMTTVNSTFAIYDREGNLIKSINADPWCSEVVANPGAFDPQIIYDHYEGRWFMLWDSQNDGTQTANFIISYSDDDDPIGNWYMYALDATVNGSIPSSPKNWGDYPQIGYDDLGIYISSRQFNFAGGYGGGKIRILNKSELYAANGGQITFTDLWNIRLLSGQSTDDLHPTISYDSGNNTAYFVIIPNTGSYYALYKITNPVTSPVLTGINFGIPFFYAAPDAQQLGGGTPLDTGPNGSGSRNAPIIRDDSLYAVHHIANSQYPSTGTSIKYFVIDLNTSTIVRQLELGAQNFYYIYPSIAVDKDHNVAITYTRSATTEYAGSYYSTRLATDPTNFLSPSKVMTEGKGNYVVTFGGDRNRWGDYLDAALDPVNEYNIWLYSEFAAAPNTWGTWLTEIRMKPFTGVYPSVSPTTADFGDVEVNTSSGMETIIIANYGEDNLVISDIAANVGPFTRTSTHSFPLTLVTYDSIYVEVVFSPTQAGDYDEMLSVSSNDPTLTDLNLAGHAYDMMQAYTDLLYSSTGPANNGDILTLDRQTGTGTTLGPSLFTEVKRLAINPDNNIMYGIVNVPSGSEIVRVNAGQGDAYKLYSLDIPFLSGIAFDNSGTLYISQQTGEIYTVDLSNGNYTFVATSNVFLNSIAFHPATNEMWAPLFRPVGTGKDTIYTINITTGLATPVGVTGLGVMTNDLAFDENDNLYGVIGGASQIGKLIQINTSDGSGTEIGEIGFNNVVGIGYSLNGPVLSIDGDGSAIPEEYSLEQNYPNPFNPVTKIKYVIPEESFVELKIYNVLGKEVRTLISDERPAGYYEVNFDAQGLPSGVYLYKLKAGSFSDTKKMILLK